MQLSSSHLTRLRGKHDPARPVVLHVRQATTVPLRSSQSTNATTAKDLFIGARVDEADLNRAGIQWSGLFGVQVPRAERVLELLKGLGLTSEDLGKVLLRYPQVFSTDETRVQSVITFLQESELKLDEQQTRELVVRFPQLFSYCVKGHLVPQLPYLTSLGVTNLRELVLARPMVLGEGIDTVVKFLRMCGVPRKEMFRLIGSYPLDFSLRIRCIDEGEMRPPFD